jgi:hypothetical protein
MSGFEEALKWVKEGQGALRTAHKRFNIQCLILLVTEQGILHSVKKCIKKQLCLIDEYGHPKNYEPTSEDVLAEDWELVKNPQWPRS